MACQGDEEELQRFLGVPSDVWLGRIDLDWNQRELGRGSDASVHRAEHAGAQVAVKVLHGILIDPDNTERRAFLQRFGVECRILRRLAHPRVIRLIGVGMAPNASPCLVVELMSNSLASRVGADPPDAFAQSLTYFLDMGEGLRFLHSHGLSHRDLKPENVLITAGRAKIADVGLARYLHRDGALNPTALTRCPGTLPFMSPESLAANPVYSLKHDIFSGGVTILSVLGGRAPTPTEPRVVQLAGGTHQAIPELQRRRGDLDRLAADHPMRNLIVSCLQDEPDLRPSAESLHVQLMEIPHSYSPNDQAYTREVCHTVISRLDTVLSSLLQQSNAIAQQSAAIAQLARQAGDTEQRMARMEEEICAARQNSVTHFDEPRQSSATLQGQLADTQLSVARITQEQRPTQRQMASLQENITSSLETVTSSIGPVAESQQATQRQVSSIHDEMSRSLQQSMAAIQQEAATDNHPSQKLITSTQQTAMATNSCGAEQLSTSSRRLNDQPEVVTGRPATSSHLVNTRRVSIVPATHVPVTAALATFSPHRCSSSIRLSDDCRTASCSRDGYVYYVVCGAQTYTSGSVQLRVLIHTTGKSRVDIAMCNLPNVQLDNAFVLPRCNYFGWCIQVPVIRSLGMQQQDMQQQDGDVIRLSLDCTRHTLTFLQERTGATETMADVTGELYLHVRMCGTSRVTLL